MWRFDDPTVTFDNPNYTFDGGYIPPSGGGGGGGGPVGTAVWAIELEVYEVTRGTLELFWLPTPIQIAPVNYQVLVNDESVQSLQGEFAIVDGLEPNETYRVKVIGGIAGQVPIQSNDYVYRYGTRDVAYVDIPPGPVPVGVPPDPPLITNVIVGNGTCLVYFDSPFSEEEITLYTLYPSSGGKITGQGSPLRAQNLTNNVAVSFQMTATSFSGESVLSAPSGLLTPMGTGIPPDAPTSVTLTPTDGGVSVAFVVGSDQGTAIQYSTVTLSTGATLGGVSPLAFTGLTNGIPVTASVTSTSAAGTGAATAGAAVTPSGKPFAPVSVVATPGNGQVSVAFLSGGNNGAAIIQYQATASTGQSATNSVSPIVIPGLTNGTAVTVKVTATNVNGLSPFSTLSASVTPSTIPGAPTGVSAVAGNASANVSFSPAANNGGAAPDLFRITATPGGAQSTGVSTTLPVNGLANGTAYTFVVEEHNVNGWGPASTASTAVTPSAPVTGALTVLPPLRSSIGQGMPLFTSWRVRGMRAGGTLVFTDGGTSSNYTTGPTGLLNGARQSGGTDTVTVSVSDGVNTGSGSATITTIANAGALALSFSPPTVAANGDLHAKMKPTGGRGAIAVTLSDTSIYSTVAAISDGWINGAPTTATGNAQTATATDATGATATASFTLTSTTAFRQYACDETAGAVNLIGNAMAGSKYSHTFRMANASGAVTGSLTSGSLPAGLSWSGASLIGTPTTAGTYVLPVLFTDSGANVTPTVNYTLTVLPAFIATRPTPAAGWTAGSGFFTLNGEFFDPSGAAWGFRGGNVDHYDDVTINYIQNTQCAAVRINFAPSVATATVSSDMSAFIAKDVMPWYAGFYDTSGGTVTSGSSSLALAGRVFNYYCNTLIPAIGTLLNSSCGLNLLNEFSPTDTVWRDVYSAVFGTVTGVNVSTGVITYSGTTFNATALGLGFVYLKGLGGIANGSYAITASGTNTLTVSGLSGTYTSGGTLCGGGIGMVRGAGYTGPLMVDANGAGQGLSSLTSYAATVTKSDPLFNTCVSYHLYGQTLNFEAPITNVSAVGSTTNVRYSWADPLNAWETAQNGGVSVDPFKKAAAGTANPNLLSVVAYGFAGVTGLNGQTLTMASWAGSSNAWTASLTGATSAGTWTAGTGYLYYAQDVRIVAQKLAALKAQGVMCLIGEFGPASPPYSGSNGGSRGPTTAGQVIAEAEANGLSWLVWATDDGSGSPNSLIGDYALFGVGGTGKGDYSIPSRATYHGQDVINNPINGWAGLSAPAPAFL